MTGPFTALRVAPDGVRVAIVIGGNELTFGAISAPAGTDPRDHALPGAGTPLTQVQPVRQPPSPALTWYGPDDVIALADPGPAVTEYPVSGGTPTSIPADAGMQSITASSGSR